MFQDSPGVTTVSACFTSQIERNKRLEMAWKSAHAHSAKVRDFLIRRDKIWEPSLSSFWYFFFSVAAGIGTGAGGFDEAVGP